MEMCGWLCDNIMAPQFSMTDASQSNLYLRTYVPLSCPIPRPPSCPIPRPPSCPIPRPPSCSFPDHLHAPFPDHLHAPFQTILMTHPQTILMSHPQTILMCYQALLYNINMGSVQCHTLLTPIPSLLSSHHFTFRRSIQITSGLS